MRITDLQDRRVVIWGAGREASATLRALGRKGVSASVAIYDENPSENAPREVEGVPVLSGDRGQVALNAADVVILSPGISRWRPEVETLRSRGVTLTTATNLWFGEAYERSIGVTGTKGKSTTSSLIAHLLTAVGEPAQLAGNIGRSPIDYVGEVDPAWWVLELSSFQTSGLGRSPDIGVFTTLSPEHLDWHGSFERYAADKINLFAHNPSIVTVANFDDAGVASVLDRLPNVLPREDHVEARGDDFVHRGQTLFPVASLRLVGRHNVRLASLALTALGAAGIDLLGQSAVLANALFAFEPLPHRLSPVATVNDVLYIDDGLATTPIATMAAVDAFTDRPVTLLAGGHDRGVSYDALGVFLAEHRNVQVITMPANGVRIRDAISAANGAPVVESSGLDDAVTRAADITPPGGVVLLSPAAASFGAFRDYVERSDAFTRAVLAL